MAEQPEWEVTLVGKWWRDNTMRFEVEDYRRSFTYKTGRGQPFTLVKLTCRITTSNVETWYGARWSQDNASGRFEVTLDVRAWDEDIAILRAKNRFENYLHFVMCRTPEIEYI